MNLQTQDRPIIQSLLQVDWYKPLMENFIHERRPDTEVCFSLINRHASRVCLPDFIDEGQLREELEHPRTLRYADDEVAFLTESTYIPKGLFNQTWLDSLRTFQLPPLDIVWKPDNYSIQARGRWGEVTHWETIVMNVVNQLYFRELMRRQGLTLDQVFAEGMRRLDEKIDLLLQHPDIRIIDFGLRRCFALLFNDLIDARLIERLPNQFVGISDVFLAKKYDMKPSGTYAHEMPMVYAALCGQDDAALRASPIQFLREWNERYGHYMTMAVSDTFGSDSFRHDIPMDLLLAILNYKIDSGEPRDQGDRWIQTFQSRDVDPLQKNLVFSDGLDIPLCIRLYDYFSGRVGVAPFGIGTHLTNDVGFTPISIVMKVIEVFLNGEWVSAVKVSDNLGKASGLQKAIERCVRVFDYHNTYRAYCEV